MFESASLTAHQNPLSLAVLSTSWVCLFEPTEVQIMLELAENIRTVLCQRTHLVKRGERYLPNTISDVRISGYLGPNVKNNRAVCDTTSDY